MRFEAKVEDLLQALTRKHILAQAVEGRGGEAREASRARMLGCDHRQSGFRYRLGAASSC